MISPSTKATSTRSFAKRSNARTTSIEVPRGSLRIRIDEARLSILSGEVEACESGTATKANNDDAFVVDSSGFLSEIEERLFPKVVECALEVPIGAKVGSTPCAADDDNGLLLFSVEENSD